MQKQILCVVLLFIFFVIKSPSNLVYALDSDGPGVSAKSAILISADTGRVLYAKNENEKLAMASTTKIMTALLAFEQAQSGDKEVEITDKMVRVEGSSMGLRAGDKISIDNLAKGMMMCSGNDAASSIAIAISGSYEEFAKLMNNRAKQIGMNDTNFVTPSGLDDENHYSTARDMAILGAYAMENPEFYDTVRQKSIKVKFINPDRCCLYNNHNKLLKQYDGCVGIKTGFTKKAGRCLVSCVEKDGVRLVAVTLNAPDDWNDHKSLYDYGFRSIERIDLDDSNVEVSVDIVGACKNKATLFCKSNTSIVLKKGEVDKLKRVVEVPRFISAPIKKDQIVGRVSYYMDDQLVGFNELVSDENIDVEENDKSVFKSIKEFFIKH